MIGSWFGSQGALLHGTAPAAWLEGSVELPAVAVAVAVGGILITGLIFFAWRAGARRDEDRASQERFERGEEELTG